MSAVLKFISGKGKRPEAPALPSPAAAIAAAASFAALTARLDYLEPAAIENFSRELIKMGTGHTKSAELKNQFEKDKT